MDVSGMKIAAMTFRLRASWVHNLKEKRMIVSSLTTKLQNRFHVSAAEIDEQDTHQVIVICVAAVVPHNAYADSLMESITGDLIAVVPFMSIAPIVLAVYLGIGILIGVFGGVNAIRNYLKV